MARRPAISFKKISPRIMGALAEYRPARIQRFEVRGNFPNTDIMEHGNQELAGTIFDIPDYTVTLSAFDVTIKWAMPWTNLNDLHRPYQQLFPLLSILVPLLP